MRPPRRVAVAVALCVVLAASGCGGGGGSTGGVREVEVATGWTGGTEEAGLDELVGEFTRTCPEYAYVNGGIEALPERLSRFDPPDSFQARAGADITGYIDAGQVASLSQEYQAWGLPDVLPKALVTTLTMREEIYSVPVGINRANVLWSNRRVLASSGITQQAPTLAAFLADLERLKARGFVPLATGRDGMALMLLEVVLVAHLGPERFIALWQDSAGWGTPKGLDADIVAAVADYQKLLAYTNKDRDALDEAGARQLLVDGKAGYLLMGDWGATDLAGGGKDYGFAAFPGTTTSFQWRADSFVRAKGSKNPEGARCWLKTIGSAAGQRAVNTRRSSIPARTDADPADYSPYQQGAMAAWKTLRPVPSCAHGSACSPGWRSAVTAALTAYSVDGNVAGLNAALLTAARRFAPR